MISDTTWEIRRDKILHNPKEIIDLLNSNHAVKKYIGRMSIGDMIYSTFYKKENDILINVDHSMSIWFQKIKENVHWNEVFTEFNKGFIIYESIFITNKLNLEQSLQFLMTDVETWLKLLIPYGKKSPDRNPLTYYITTIIGTMAKTKCRASVQLVKTWSRE